MPSNMNPLQLMQLVRSSKNPPEFVMNMLQQSSGNPFFANLMNLAQNNKTKDIESIARNTFKEKGLDFDKEFNDFKNQWGL